MKAHFEKPLNLPLRYQKTEGVDFLTKSIQKAEVYTALASIYDEVMENVDYETWADYIDEILMIHHPNAVKIHELACGTGTMALSLEELGYYNISASDGSAEMIHIAQEKAKEADSTITFEVIDFLNIPGHIRYDAVFMVFDSINYLHHPEEILSLHRQVYDILNPGGLFIYDFTTPHNSRQAIHVLNNVSRRISPNLRFHRESSYDAKNRIHSNNFLIEHRNPEKPHTKQYTEEKHAQKIYTTEEIFRIVESTQFQVLGSYDGFEIKPAHDRSLRITMVLKK